ncbi:hypothetical protein LOZ12_001014 [Ophidiomyces ophidiicola]|uniref:Uncharacterized protein n=1 Tax=Ophidiomyces ophidiicola TaxID=1387563 RepID=A0ACB8V3T7_9EURO|nr:hypothetical protein LOZ64_001457 [Ophidiomyces ophidiicola]KAI1963171.1 hypothetical protein LOZ56_006488 [Ophidiomyces ophidiicola]KAI1968363.1 hypothetical protein LOZ59_000216 [Ophidiomyces ophidiicola]KAI2021926.1 hypothetical protein LOZ46_002057 [Ophidiomyces ophidiicola]KAI2031553.1 hypothetical protein LOZ47_006100 [Ophidiomyces ophidiicola]
MVALVACGHTLGGVHGANFPLIVRPGSAPDDFTLLDGTRGFDERIASNFVNNVAGNPLTSPFARANSRDSDNKVFSIDGNATIRALADPAVFRTTCARVLQQMIDTVPRGVNLSAAPLTPYELKPVNLSLALSANDSLRFTGSLRLRTTARPLSTVSALSLRYAPRQGPAACPSCVVPARLAATDALFGESFAYYAFDAAIPANASIASFTAHLALADGQSVTFDNNAARFPVSDAVLLLPAQSCVVATTLTVVAAVRNTLTAPNVSLALTTKTPRDCCVVPALTTTTLPMTRGAAAGSLYTLYTVSLPLDAANRPIARFDVVAVSGDTTFTDGFRATADLPARCTPFGEEPLPPSYTFEGCFTDSVGARALTGGASVDAQMTIARCAASCAAFQFFGLEYATECFCGNARAPASTPVAAAECNMPCGGDRSQTCGAANRLSLYRHTAWRPATAPAVVAGTYAHRGCFNDSAATRALRGRFEFSADAMSLDRCATFCNGTRFFGAEYGSECFCGAVLEAASVRQPDADCSMLCSGNATQLCGGSNRLSLYEKLNSTMLVRRARLVVR